MLTSSQLRNKELFSKISDADTAASTIHDGMTIGVSGFTPAGYPKAVPHALAEQVKGGRRCKVNIWSGASVGPEVEEELAAAGAVDMRLPYYAASNKSMRTGINDGTIRYTDIHLSHTAQQVNYNFLGKVDVMIVEAIAVTEDGHLVLTTGVGNTPLLVQNADRVIVELNTAQPAELEGMHDIYIQKKPPYRKPIPILTPRDRVGTPYTICGIDKISHIVETDIADKTRTLQPPNQKSRDIARHLIDFLKYEVQHDRLPKGLLPFQSGVGSIANAVLEGLKNSGFQYLNMYSEILQDAVFDLIDAGVLDFASGCAFTPSQSVLSRFRSDPEKYRSRIVLRPLDITNHPETTRRLGLITINTALEIDIYGNVNSTHIMGTHVMNGIGGSADFTRNGYLTIFTTESTAKEDTISRIVPMCSHIDSTEHDVHVFITEWGVADVRGTSPRDRSRLIINRCAHPLYRDQLMDYVERAERDVGGHVPHLLDEAFSWHTKYRDKGTMYLQGGMEPEQAGEAAS